MSTEETDAESLPLHGVKVLEFTHVIAGPSAGVLLADLGAQVIKIEPPVGDQFRTASPAMFGLFNRNKLSVVVDLKTPDGRAAVRRLAEHSDVVIENMAPGVSDRLGISYEQLVDVNPGLIYLALKDFLPGPYERRPMLDELAQMMGGLAFMTGPSGQPLRVGASVVDIGTAAYGVVGVLAALHQRASTGRGQKITAGLYETVVYWVCQHMASAALSGEPSVPLPDMPQAQRLRWGVYDLFQTSDGVDVFVGVTSDAQWARFCRGFGFLDLLEDARLRTNGDRAVCRDWLIPLLHERLRHCSGAELERRLDESGVPFAPLRRPDQLFDDAQLRESGQLADTPVPSRGIVALPKPPIRTSEYEVAVRCGATQLGEHTLNVLLHAGFAEQQIVDMCRSGAAQTNDSQ